MLSLTMNGISSTTSYTGSCFSSQKIPGKASVRPVCYRHGMGSSMPCAMGRCWCAGSMLGERPPLMSCRNWLTWVPPGTLSWGNVGWCSHCPARNWLTSPVLLMESWSCTAGMWKSSQLQGFLQHFCPFRGHTDIYKGVSLLGLPWSEQGLESACTVCLGSLEGNLRSPRAFLVCFPGMNTSSMHMAHHSQTLPSCRLASKSLWGAWGMPGSS